MKTTTPKKDQLRLAMDNAKKLHVMCYAISRIDNSVIKIVRGELGFYPVHSSTLTAGVAIGDYVKAMNAACGVSNAQAAAMEAGSMFGWHIPGACPDMYSNDGKLRKNTAPNT